MFGWIALAVVVLVVAYVIMRLRETIANAGVEPTLIFVLGGESIREKYAAELAQSDEYIDLPIVVSSGSNSLRHFQAAGVTESRITLDQKAVDTVTNFTTLAASFKRKGHKNVYLVTSDYHMRRAYACGCIIFGSYGIALTAAVVASPSTRPLEPLLKVLRDIGRSLVWCVTGIEFRNVALRSHPERASAASV